jgi:integrase
MASIRKRGETFTITAYLGYDDSGKQIKKTTTFSPPAGVTNGKAEKLAREFAVKWEDKIRGYVALDENRTFAELAKWYYEVIAPNTLKPNILISYQHDIHNHIIPRLGRVKLKDVTPQMLDSLFKDIKQNGNLERSYKLKDITLFDGVKREEFWKAAGLNRESMYGILRGNSCRRPNAEKMAAGLGLPVEKVFDDVSLTHGMTGASVNKLKLNLSAIFTAAVKKEIMRRNPCQLVTPPKVDTPPAAFYDEGQARALLAACHEQNDFQLEVIINLFLATGIRAGELTALHWDDLDEITGVLFVQKTLVRINGAFVRQETKTELSTRRIVLPPYIMQLLGEHRQRQRERRSAIADVWKNPADIMFTNLSGDYFNGINLNRKLKDILKTAGLPDIHLHSLRHTHASLLINSDVTAKVIASRLGHSTTKTTLDTYSHVFAASEVKAMQAVEMKLFDNGQITE